MSVYMYPNSHLPETETEQGSYWYRRPWNEDAKPNHCGIHSRNTLYLHEEKKNQTSRGCIFKLSDTSSAKRL